MLVPTIRTTCTTKELCGAIIKAWNDLYNSIPSKEAVGIVVSQHDIETGSGNACWNWNIGNIKYNKAAGDVPYIALNGVWEIINGHKVIIPPSNPGAWFRAFPTLLDGVKFHLNLLKTGRYSSSWPAIEAGDVALFAHLLRLRGYYTAPEADYVAGMNRFFKPFMNSQDYDQALSDYQTTDIAPPDTHTDPSYTDSTDGEVMSKMSIHQGIDANSQPISIEAGFVATIKTAIENLVEWLKQKS